MLLNRAGQVFIARRIDEIVEAWQMPQGGIDAGEEPRTAALRELGEEVGTTKATIIAESRDWLSYDLPDALVPIIWKGQYRGQKQKWFVMRFEGEDADINIATAHPEFSEWKWAPMETLPDVIVPFKRALYAALVAEFRHLVTAPSP
jgi:putative (di)nucleoside polyphosphate hydrolase